MEIRRKRRKRRSRLKKNIFVIAFWSILIGLIAGLVFLIYNIVTIGVNDGVENIGMHRELFWDDHLIDTEKTTATFTQHIAQKKEIILEIDKPWEGNIADSFNIIKDGDIFRMYYLTYTVNSAAKLCYAQSYDGITWEKPQVNITEFNKSTDNNILLGEDAGIANSFCAFLDEKAGVNDNKKYKAIAVNTDNSLVSYTSADGLNWKKNGDVGSKISASSTPIALNTALYNKEHKLYYCYFIESENNKQEIYVTSSKNFKTWKAPQRISYQENANEFNMQTANISNYYRAPQLFLGLPLRKTEIDTANINYTALTNNNGRQSAFLSENNLSSQITDTVFMTSRNGKAWNLNEEAFMSSGAEHDLNWIFGDNFVAAGMIETPSLHSNAGEDNELSLYSAENHFAEGGTKLRRYITRIDGLASYKSTYNTQKIVTKPIKFEGSRMTLNFRTSPNGYVFVRILDKNGEPFKAIEYENSEKIKYEVPAYTSYELFGDKVDREVAFNADLAKLNGKTVILEFYMSDADVFSFKFDNEPYENTESWQPIEIPMREYSNFEYENTNETINIGKERQLFWDDFIVDKTKTDALSVAHSPVMKEEIFKTDLPWEGNNCDFYVVLDDTDENGQPFHRMYYLGWDDSAPTDIRVCYAYSYDGSEWVKPNLGIHSFTDKNTGEIYNETNIMLYTEEEIFDNFFVFKDTRPEVKAKERYKAIAQGGSDQEGLPSYGLWAWVSADGLHWKKTHRVLPSLEEWFGAFDSVNTMLWDEKTQQFFTFFRVREEQSLNGIDFTEFRKIKGAVAKDFVPFETDTIYDLNYGSNSPIFEMYTNNISKYYRAPQMFMGFPTRFSRRFEWAKNYEYLTSPSARRAGFNSGQVTKYLSMTEALFMTSRDGYNWNRQNESWLTPGPEHEANWIYGNCYPAYGLIETKTENAGQDNELSTYVFEGKFYKAPSVLYRYTMRIDGLRSYKATYNAQKLTTKPIVFTGDTLLINFKTSSAGSVIVKILDENGNELEGYNSGKIIGDRVDRTVAFEKALADINGQRVILEFTMSDAQIYSFKFN